MLIICTRAHEVWTTQCWAGKCLTTGSSLWPSLPLPLSTCFAVFADGVHTPPMADFQASHRAHWTPSWKRDSLSHKQVRAGPSTPLARPSSLVCRLGSWYTVCPRTGYKPSTFLTLCAGAPRLRSANPMGLRASVPGVGQDNRAAATQEESPAWKQEN